MGAWPFGKPTNTADRRRADQAAQDSTPSRVWLLSLTVGTAAVVALIVIPSDSPSYEFLSLVTSLVALVVLFGAALGSSAQARLVWWSLFAFQLLTMAAVAFQSWEQSNDTGQFPDLSDAIFLAAYLPAIVALSTLLHRRSPGNDREAWIDSAILTVTAISVFGLLILAPTASASGLSGAATLVALAYPMLDLVLLSVLIWLLVGARRSTVSLVLLALSFGLTLVADITRDLLVIEDPSAALPPWISVLRIAALVLMAAAATAPSAAAIADPIESRDVRISTPRLFVLAIGVLTVPALVAYRLWGDPRQDTLMLALAAVIVIILAVWRIQILVSTVERQRAVTSLVLDSTGDGIVGLDRQGFVLFANLAARRMLRCREVDLIGRRFHDVAHHELPDGTPLHWLDCPVSALVTSGEPSFLQDQRYIRRDGTAFPVEIVMSPLIVEGAVAGAVQSFRDVSEREEMEEIKRQFVAVVSHELRTPLTSIKGSLQMLDSGLLGDLTDDQQELVSMAVANSERLGALVDDILDLERLDSGRMPLEPLEVSASEIVTQAVRGVTGAADAAGVFLRTDVPRDGTDVAVLADPHRMIQVLTNLIGNAIKFSERGSTVVARAQRDGDDVRLAVVDSGRGIPPDRIAAVFERFGQVEGGDARRQGGTGLGLAISQEIVVRSGGTISVASTLGEGSTFTVTLPALHPAESSVEVSP